MTRVVLGVLLVLCVPAHAWAQSGASFADVSRTAALGEAVVGRPGDVSAIWYNPGALADVERPQLALSTHYGHMDLWFRRTEESRESMDRSMSGFGFAVASGFRGPRWVERFSAGAGFYVPAEALRLEAPVRSDIPSFPLYGNRLDHVNGTLALGVDLLDWLSVGAAITLTPNLTLPTEVRYVAGRGDSPDDEVVVNITRELQTRVAPIFGLRLRPIDALCIGVAWRGKTSVAATGPNDTIAGAVVVNEQLDFFDFWAPDQLAFGASWLPRRRYSLSADVTWARWSAYRTIHNDDAEPAFDDVLLLHAGAEYALGRATALRLGYGYEPSPVPAQGAVSNFLDADRHVVSLGAGVDLRELTSTQLELDFHARAHFLGEQSAEKDVDALPDADDGTEGQQIDNLGYPGFSAGGFVWQAGLSLTVYIQEGGSDALSAILVLGCALLVPMTATAGVEDMIGLGAQATALCGSMTARPGDFSAVYYNPAGLAPGLHDADPSGFVELSLGFVYATPIVDVEATGGGSVDVATDTPATTGIQLGTRFDLGSSFGVDGLVIGASAYLPPNFFGYEIHPDDDVQWLFLSDRTQHLSIAAGLGWRALPWLSFGVGMRVLFDLQTITLGRVTDVEPREEGGLQVSTQLGEDVTVFGRVAPTIGVLRDAEPDLRIGLSWRGELYVDDWGHTRVAGVPGFGDLGYAHRFAHYFEPHQLTGGLAVRPVPRAWVSADVTYNAWSRALTKNHNQFGDGYFGDTVSLALGADFAIRSAMTLRWGYQYTPSPYDNFGGRNNWMDTDRHTLSTGAAIDLGALFRADNLPLRMDLAFQLAVLPDRTEGEGRRRFESDAELEANPGYPGYTFGGVVPAFQIGFEVDL